MIVLDSRLLPGKENAPVKYLAMRWVVGHPEGYVILAHAAIR
jgi:hypothetical protein